MHQITYENMDLIPMKPILKRKGKPRKKWIEEVTQYVWNTIRTDENELFTNTEEQRQTLKEHAFEYRGLFNVQMEKRRPEPVPIIP